MVKSIRATEAFLSRHGHVCVMSVWGHSMRVVDACKTGDRRREGGHLCGKTAPYYSYSNTL